MRRAAVKDEGDGSQCVITTYTHPSIKLLSVYLRARRTYLLARIDQVFEEEGFSIQVRPFSHVALRIFLPLHAYTIEINWALSTEPRVLWP